MKAYDRVKLDQWFLASVGTVFLALSLAGLIHSMAAAWASRLSYRAQMANPPLEVEQVLAMCHRAYVLYPWNYYFSIFAAEAAFYQADKVQGEARTARLAQSKLWCERGLIQNPYKSQLRRLQTRFLWEDSPAEAIVYWAAYTDWQFWEPYNHATLAELYARHGDIEKAEQELKWVEGDVSYPRVRETVLREKKSWEAILNGKPEEWGE